jgi:hypothetical protein
MRSTGIVAAALEAAKRAGVTRTSENPGRQHGREVARRDGIALGTQVEGASVSQIMG